MRKSLKYQHPTHKHTHTRALALEVMPNIFFFPSHNFGKRIIPNENWNGTDNDSNASHYLYIQKLDNENVFTRYGFRLNGSTADAAAAIFTACSAITELVERLLTTTVTATKTATAASKTQGASHDDNTARRFPMFG